MKNSLNERYQRAAEDRLFNFRPLFFTAAFFALGIWFAYLRRCAGVSAWWSLAPLSLAVFPLCFCGSRARAKRVLLAALAMALAYWSGFGAFYGQINGYEKSGKYADEYPVVGRVTEIVIFDGAASVTLDRVIVDGEREKGKLVAYLPASYAENLELADEVLLRGSVYTLTADNVYFVGDNVRFQAYADTCTVTGRDFDLFLWTKNRIRKAVYAGMDETTAAVTMAVLTGDTSGMDDGLLENMRRGGIAHIFAVSGLHIGALFAFCLMLAKKTKLKNAPKLTRFFLTAAVLLFYGGVCGYSASVVRAIVTCLAFYASTLTGIYSDGLERVGLSALVVLCVSPVSLLRAGFQLTYAACIGIVALARPVSAAIDRALPHFKRSSQTQGGERKPLTVGQLARRKAVDYLGVTVAAQLATAPILLSDFGYVSGWSLLLNCLFVPLVSAAFSALLVFVLVASVLPLAASGAVLYVPYVLWSALLLLFQTVDFSSFALENVRLSAAAIAFYYAAWSFATDKWNVSKKGRATAFVLFAAGFCFAVVAANL